LPLHQGDSGSGALQRGTSAGGLSIECLAGTVRLGGGADWTFGGCTWRGSECVGGIGENRTASHKVPSPRKCAGFRVEELCRRGYDMVPVNPRAWEALGRRCFARLLDIQPTTRRSW